VTQQPAPLIHKTVPSNTDTEKPAAGFQAFLVKRVMNGLRKG
jgi:hypothetical protein